MRHINTLTGVVALACCASVSALDVTLEDFSNTEYLQINGNAAVVTTADGAVLRLTQARMLQAGSVFSKVMVNTAKFSTFFKFRITHPDYWGADGMVFVVQPVSSSAGGAGGGLGYANIPASVGVEFDTFDNGGGYPNDPNANHIGININGSFNGPTVPVSIPFQDGALWSVWVDYDGSQLEVRANTTGERPDSPLLTRSLNISAVLGGIPEAYIGFTAATGGGYENHDIITWSFRDEYNPNPIGEGGTCVLEFDSEPEMSCYEQRYNSVTCEGAIGNEFSQGIVIDSEWYQSHTCAELREDGTIPHWVKLLATGVNLTATVNGSGIDLTLTTSAEPDTAALSILRGDKLENGGTEINVVCEFPSGGSPYTCTDTVVGDTYRVLETEYDGDLIVYDEVTPK